MNKLIEAIAFATEKHANQRRDDPAQSPYINHPVAVANILANEAAIDDKRTLIAAILHDVIEDTDTTAQELVRLFGQEITDIVLDVSDDKSLPKEERKRLQIEKAPHICRRAKLIKMADKTANLRDMAQAIPLGWSVERTRDYFDWAKAVVDGMRGVHPQLEKLFDVAYQSKPEASPAD